MSRFHDEFFKQKGTEHDNLLIKFVSELDDCDLVYDIQNYIYKYCKAKNYETSDYIEKYETEVLCKNGTFIIGYADVVFSVTLPHKNSNEYNPLPLKYQCIMEIKPQLTDAGAVLRQLKTYADILKIYDQFYYVKSQENPFADARRGRVIPGNLMIVTKTKPDDSVINYLEHEGVRVIVFDEGT